MKLLDLIREAGIVGAGGAGFPTHIKLNAKAEYILLNGAECEPLLRVDQQIMELFPDEIIKGFEYAGRLVEAKKAIIGIKSKHKKVIAILRERIEALQFQDFIDVKELPDIYPAGDEQVLVYELTGKVVPETAIPLEVGCVVLNSETALNIFNASLNKPVIEKYLTIAGDVPNRLTVKVPVGTPIIDVLKLSGINCFEDYVVIDGGPMMGPVLKDLNGYVNKKNKGFIILKRGHFIAKKKTVSLDQAKKINKAACEQCRMCTDLCPRFLLGHEIHPHKMMTAINYSHTNLEGQLNAQLCCQCNLCELFSCQSGLHPRLANGYFKEKLAEENLRYIPKKKESKARIAREYRLLPSKRLIARLGLHSMDKPAPLKQMDTKPAEVYISTRQHVGAPAIPVVAEGDQVSPGQLIGRIPEGSLGAAIHASIPGEIVQVTTDFIVIGRN